ncbi:UDP-N-acetylglucosamine--N-acetylmuramyl-(pentapeptide) pyrophosphoryl-undecaprenol N-acetylglucosamine transferase [Cardinium endosymbiont of Oedothorax gibbosus]|uniref:UDP-N-acetylglucosamine--N-acetylmuramyl- (pentapeptide) pyrophosphoryl-undecaprenol N-acetylglucosamine transferase n=1 Tax=Cardinium endosymbiont of Oedothorax gibbosus TaxID=931101 RepID=UPI00202596A1|nr:UDP-N-acetylglucosamine--N-acetylmuramyl-(pentapeptide) pyrophosphoryl-undecaprenol N-acetylglucosamine transferase [Cardinium endosymbiont of Oedothorax gibbosus]CAH2559792.1 UDP-N-acetylglucosamine--N-acetylmuramyl-(pentapeptide)pyrophosphoryl-undecaprenolN-acetylglucosaminetransferase [Cardinium endosymbiont of Oedothorax gibbosus]
MRVLIGCGGTGGHIYPAIATADGIKSKFRDAVFLFVGAKGGREVGLVVAAGYSIKPISIRGFQRKKVLKNVCFPFLLFKSLYQARSIIQSFKPDVVIGTGGYASFPTLFVAAMQKIPTLIQEQNSVVGLTNQFLVRLVSKICTGYPDVVLPCVKEKVVFTGNPIRSALCTFQEDQMDALEYFGFSGFQERKCLLVIGGSGGASVLNTTILEWRAQLCALDMQVIWITGERYFESIKKAMKDYRSIKCYPFLSNMEMAYAAADIVVSRAGALSIAELCVRRKLTILVPSSNVVGDHQTKNSLPLADQGAVICITDQECPFLLIPKVMELLNDEAQSLELVQRMEPFAALHAGAQDKIADVVVDLVKSNADCGPSKSLDFN